MYFTRNPKRFPEENGVFQYSFGFLAEDPVPAKRTVPAFQRAQEPVATERG